MNSPVNFLKFSKMISMRRIFQIGVLMLSLAGFVGISTYSAAQEQSSQQQSPQKQASQEPSVPEPLPLSQPPKTKHEPGFGRQLSHQTREAAGEEKDETAEFKQSPSVQFVARVTGLSIPHAYLFSVLFNFAVVAIVIVWAAAKFLPGVFRARTSAIQKAMQEAQRASEEARRRLADIESRLSKLDTEIANMRNAAEKDAADEEVRIQAAAEEEKRKIVESAQQEIAAAAKAARRDLTAYAADLAIGLAKKQIHVDAATDQSLVRNFAGQLGTYSESGSAGQGSAGKDKN
jgi:F-type H+-transporting ATPase subunit b